MYANVYVISRHYGGPEEGGWWFDWYDHIHYLPCKQANCERVQAKLARRYSNLTEGDLNSVLGGQEGIVMIEDKIAESQTKQRPYYC